MHDKTAFQVYNLLIMVKQKFAAFDIDGTLFRSGLFQEVAYELMKMGALPHTMLEQTTAANREWRHRTHGDAFQEFEMLVVNSIDEALPQLRIADYEKAAQRVIKKRAENVYVYTRDLIAELKAKGYFIVAISGSQIELVEPFAKKYGFDGWVGQQWERGEEFFTGKITKTHTGKDLILNRLIEEHNLTLKDSYAIGDSNGDVGMLSMVENPIAFNPTFELYEKAVKNNWQITVERKNVMYTMRPNSTTGSYDLAEARSH